MASPEAIALAAEMDRERTRIERVGIRATTRIARAVRVSVLRAFQSGSSLTDAIAVAMAEATPIVTGGMVSGYLSGQVRGGLNVPESMAKALRFSTGYEATIERLIRKADAAQSDLERINSIFRPKAASAVNEATIRLTKFVADATTDIFRRGLHTQGGIAEIRKAFDAAGVTPQSPYLLEAIYRKEVGAAYTAGRLDFNAQPEVQEILWGYEYVTVGDDRVRESHEALDGTRKPKGDPFWDKYMPPWDWGCRCTTIEVFRDETIATPKEPVGYPAADEGFDVNPALALLAA